MRRCVRGIVGATLLLLATGGSAAIAAACGGKPPTSATVEQEADAEGSEHAVLIEVPRREGHFWSSDEVKYLHEFQDVLDERLRAAGAGEVDGDFFGEGLCTIYVYGGDADVMFEHVRMAHEQMPLHRSTVVVKQYGDVDHGAREERHPLNP